MLFSFYECLTPVGIVALCFHLNRQDFQWGTKQGIKKKTWYISLFVFQRLLRKRHAFKISHKIFLFLLMGVPFYLWVFT